MTQIGTYDNLLTAISHERMIDQGIVIYYRYEFARLIKKLKVAKSQQKIHKMISTAPTIRKYRDKECSVILESTRISILKKYNDQMD